MQIIGSVQIVTNVTSVVPTFFAALRFLIFFFCLALLLILLYLLECAGEFRSCGSDHGLCPLDSHKPLKRLDRNFYMGFAWHLRPRRKRFLQLTAKLKPPPPKKNKKARTEFYRFRQFIGSYYFQSVISAEVIKSHWIYHSKRCKLPA